MGSMKPILTEKNLRQNKTEAAYDKRLWRLKLAGEIIDYRFEAWKLILVHGIPKLRNEMSYTPDFLVVRSDRFEFHEVKGYWKEDARLKIKMAAELYPWCRFFGVTLKNGIWRFEEF